MSKQTQPRLLWQPDEHTIKEANLSQYMYWLKGCKKLTFDDYAALWQWSIDNPEDFWTSQLEYFEVIYDGTWQQVMNQPDMPGVRWFEGISLNYAEHIFRQKTNRHPVIVAKSEGQPLQTISWQELEEKVAAFQQFLLNQGVKQGDRVAAYLPNIPEAIIAFLAVNALGAVWSSTSPDFGTSSVVDRLAQIGPSVLIAVDHYRYGGKQFDRSQTLSDIISAINSITTVVLVEPSGRLKPGRPLQVTDWQQATTPAEAPLSFNRIPFNDPIWVLYSSGTTGLPKAITHSMGGILLEHLKYLTFHNDVHPCERCFWYTTTGWMMWNYIVGSLLAGSTVVLYDGSPAWPDMNTLWQFAEEASITHFGTSAGFVIANMKAQTQPGSDFDLQHLRSIGSTGSPLPPEGFDWIYREVKQDLWLASISGGTDVCSAFVGGNPLWPVYEGEIQCRALGCALYAYNEAGQPVIGEMGEMVITKPMPSMPVFLWGDDNYQRYKESYFSMYPGVWRHGDWTEITPRQGVIIYGRSDSTLNRGGVRIGTAEIYRAVDTLPEIADSLVVYLDRDDNELMPLFVKMNPGYELTDDLAQKIKTTIRQAFSPRHVPDVVLAVPDIPYTISGKKMETPIKRILLGQDPAKVINRDAMRNPQALEYFLELTL